MPKAKIRLKRKLRAAARRAGLKPGTDRWNAYVEGTAARVFGRERSRRRKRRHRR